MKTINSVIEYSNTANMQNEVVHAIIVKLHQFLESDIRSSKFKYKDTKLNCSIKTRSGSVSNLITKFHINLDGTTLNIDFGFIRDSIDLEYNSKTDTKHIFYIGKYAKNPEDQIIVDVIPLSSSKIKCDLSECGFTSYKYLFTVTTTKEKEVKISV